MLDHKNFVATDVSALLFQIRGGKAENHLQYGGAILEALRARSTMHGRQGP
jgi:hypothetical protein